MEINENPKNLNPNNQFDNDIIQKQSYKIINENMLLKNSPLNTKNNSIYNSKNKLNKVHNNDNDEENDINLNININNYLSKHNINNNQKTKKQKIILKKSNTTKNKENNCYLLPNSYKNIHINNKIRNINNKKENNDIMKSKLLARIKQQKQSLKNFDYKLQNINNNSYMINNKKNEGILITKKEKEGKDENGNGENKKNEKEENKHIPKILTFLRTFKNFALPLKSNNNEKKENENSNNNNINKKDDKNFIINPNNSCYNFSSKLKPNVGKLNLNLNKRNIGNLNNKYSTDNNEQIYDRNEGEDFIDYNRFTFRNNIGEDDIPYKDFDKIKAEDKKLYSSIDNNINKYKDLNDNKVNQNINTDENNKKINNFTNQKINNQKIINHTKSENIFCKIKNKNLKIEELSPNFKKQYINKNFYQNIFINNTKPYFRKKYLKNKYNSPKPEPKNKTKNNNTIYTYNNISKQNMIKKSNQPFDNYYEENDNSNDFNNNDNDNSFHSLIISKRYRKPILNVSFQRNNNFKNNKAYSYYNDISMDNINFSNNYNTINRPIKNNKIHEIVINMNDSINSFSNEPNYNTANNLNSNRSPLKNKLYGTNVNNSTIMKNIYYAKRSPLSSKQNGGAFDFSENYDTNQIGDFGEDEEELSNNFNKRNTNYSRFMEPFHRNENQKWYNEDSYYSFDIVNMNKNAKSKHLLYHKPVRLGINKNMNKNNSMYIKRVVHYDNKKYSLYLDSDANDSDNKLKNRFDNLDCEEKENNIFDFDAPRSIKDSIDDLSNNNSEMVNDSSRENQFSINSDISTNKLNVSGNNNNQNNGDSSNVNDKNNNQNLSDRNKQKIVYMKKLNSVYNFYQGTKKLFSKINDKVFKIHKKDEKDNNNITQKNHDDQNLIKNKNDISNKNYEKNNVNNNDLLTYDGVITPRMKVEDNDISYFTKNSMNTPFGEDNSKKNKKLDNLVINKKVINEKNTFFKKYYNFYISKNYNKANGGYFSKILSYKAYKLPNKSLCYMSKEKINIYKIPKNNNKCYFEKINVINNGSINKNIIHQKIFSFFSIGGNEDVNGNESNIAVNEQTKIEEENIKIMNLKQKLLIGDKQIDLLLSSGDFNKIENIDKSFSFKDNKNLNSNNISNNINENSIEINNFNFTLPPKTIKNSFESKNIIPEKNNILSILNKKENKDNDKINQYDYSYILSFKNNKLSKNSDSLPKNVLEHFENLNKEKELFPLYFNKKKEENKDKRKLKKEEIQDLIKKYFTPNKKEAIKKMLNQNCLTDNKKNEIFKSKNPTSSEIKLNMEWTRNDLSKEIEQAEKYIKELKIKMEKNTKRSDILCLLNILTVDNLNAILNKIIELITKNNKELLSVKEIIDNEYFLIKIIVDKSITEKRFVNLYAKLCYELYNKLNDIIYNQINFKNILLQECTLKFNELKNINNDKNNGININLNEEIFFTIKKKFLGNIDFICELINVNILQSDIGFYYLEELFKKYNNINNTNEIEQFKNNLCLEGIVNFLSKFGKKIYESKNVKDFKYLNAFIENNLSPILEKEKLPGFLKYKIINLIEKQKNKWKDSLYEKSILAKGKNNTRKKNNSISPNKNQRLRKRRHSNKKIKSISPDNSITNNNNQNTTENKGYNTYKNKLNIDNTNCMTSSSININTDNNNEEIIKLIQNDLEKYEIFLKDNSILNKSDLDKNNQIGNEYDWSAIEDILSNNNIDLGEVIRCYVEVCIDLTEDKKKVFIANDYIKNIISYYSINLNNREKDIIHNKMINLYRNIQDICIDNFNMKEIMGYLLFILIENKLNFIKDLNNFIGMDKEIIITIAEVIKFSIISSEAKSKKYHNDFKQTKLFVDNNIFNDFVTNKIQLSLNQI